MSRRRKRRPAPAPTPKLQRVPPPGGPPPEDPDQVALKIISDPWFADMPKRITALAYTAARAEYAEYHNQREAMDCAQVAAWKAGGPEPLWLRKMRRTGHMPVVQIGRDDVAGIVNRHIQGASYEQIGAETGLDPDVIRYLIEEGDPDGDDPPK